MKRIMMRGTLLLCGVLLSGGCRKDLCYDHDRHAPRVQVSLQPAWECVWEYDHGMAWSENWNAERFSREYEELHPEQATGIAAFVFNEDGSRTEYHLPDEGGLLPMSEGRKSLLFYNDDTSYIVFGNLDSWASATATTRTRTRATYTELHGNERTVNAPDVLYWARVEQFDAERTLGPVALPILFRPLVYTYMVRYEFDEGLEHVARARGALAGMAGSVYLQDGSTGDEAATVLYDCEITDYGVEALVTSFGVPGFSPDTRTTRADNTHGVNLEVMLTNGNLKNFDFDVTDQMAQQPRGGVITVSGLTVSREEASVESGFDVVVNGWGEYEDIEMPLN